MSLIQHGGVVIDSRGSVAGTTHGKTLAGNIAKTRRVPRNQLTTYTGPLRVAVSALSQRWGQTLSAGQRAGWRALAVANPTTDQFGNPRFLSGFAIYVRVNQNRRAAGLAFLDASPGTQAGTALLTATLTVTTAPLVSVAFTATPLITPHRLYVFATPSLSPGLASVSRHRKLVHVSADAVASPRDITAAYLARFPTPRLGKQVTVQVATLQGTDGRITAFLTSSAIVT
jgi:hypothetical protein